MLLHKPDAIPKDKQIRASDVFEAGSYDRLVTKIVDRYAHELSYKGLRDRVQALADRFGLDLQSISSSLESLQHFAELRNELIHTSSCFRYVVGDSHGAISVQPHQGNSVSYDLALQSIDLSADVPARLAEVIGLKFFGRAPAIAEGLKA